MSEEMRKKAQAMTIVKLLIPIISFMLIAYLLAKVGQEFYRESGPQACLASLSAQNWVIQQTAIIRAGGARPVEELARTQKPWPRSCRTEDKILRTQAVPDVTRDVIRLMSDCWYQMGSSRFSPFEADWLTPGDKCFICYTFRAPRLEAPITDVQFNTYLKELSMPGADVSLYWYFNGNLFMENRLGVEYGQNVPMLNSDITAQEYYAVVFLDMQNAAASNLLDDHLLSIFNQVPEDERRGISKLYVTQIEQARRCIEGGDESRTGD